MRRVMVVGRSGAGKSTLLQALGGCLGPRHKTQMIEFRDWAVDTPGEYSEMPRFYHFLISTAQRAAVVLLVQDAVATRSYLPPGFCSAIRSCTVGVVTKIDLPDARPERAAAHLRQVGVRGEIFRVSAVTGEGVADLRRRLLVLTEGGVGSDFGSPGDGGDQGAGGRH